MFSEWWGFLSVGNIRSSQCFLLGKNLDEPGDDMDMEGVGVALLVAARELIVVGAFYEIPVVL